MKENEITESYHDRYLRQLPIIGWGPEAQDRLSRSKVTVIGAGGLGSPVLYYLAAAGIGSITICDYQLVEPSNLNRQILFGVRDIGKPKAERAQNRLKDLNPELEIRAVTKALTDDGDDILAGSDLVIDCLDNFETRHAANRWCWKHRVPLIHAGIRDFYGQLLFIRPPDSPCLACFLPPTDPTEGVPPVAGITAGVVGSLQATEALKYLGGIHEVEAGVLRMIDCRSMQIDSLTLQRRSDCPVCGGGLK